MQGLQQAVQVPTGGKARNREITPKVTEVVPSQVFKNVNVQKHHLDDSEM